MGTHNLAAVFRRRDRLTALLGRLVAAGVDDPVPWAEAVRAVVPDADYRAAFQSAVLCRKDQEAVRPFAWAVAGNARALAAGVVAVPGQWGSARVSSPVQVRAASPFVGKDGKRRVRLWLTALAGPGCPGVTTVSWTYQQASYLARHPKGLGFGVGPGKAYRHPRQLVGTRMLADLSPAVPNPKVEKVRGTESLRKYNAALTAMRLRFGFTCPRGFTHHCHDCPVGYLSCPAGTHRDDYKSVRCRACGRDAYADPARSVDTCVTCLDTKEWGT